MCDNQMVAHLSGGKSKTVRNSHWQRFGVPGPCQYNSFAAFTQFLSNRHHVSERLARVMHGRFKIDDWNARIFHESTKNRISALFVPILQCGESTNANSHTVSLEHADELGDMLSLIAVHHSAFTMFESPTRSTGFQHHRIAAEFVDADLHRSARSQTRIEKDERDRFAIERS